MLKLLLLSSNCLITDTSGAKLIELNHKIMVTFLRLNEKFFAVLFFLYSFGQTA